MGDCGGRRRVGTERIRVNTGRGVVGKECTSWVVLREREVYSV